MRKRCFTQVPVKNGEPEVRVGAGQALHCLSGSQMDVS